MAKGVKEWERGGGDVDWGRNRPASCSEGLGAQELLRLLQLLHLLLLQSLQL